MPKSAKSDLNFLDRKNRGEMSMEKNRIRPIKSGKSFRMSYSRQKEVLEMPNLIEIQVDSYKWFLESGLKEVFDDISPITDYSGKLSLEFVDFTLCEDDVKYSIEECKERDATYAAPLKVKVRLHNKENDEINEHEIDSSTGSCIKPVIRGLQSQLQEARSKHLLVFLSFMFFIYNQQTITERQYTFSKDHKVNTYSPIRNIFSLAIIQKSFYTIQIHLP